MFSYRISPFEPVMSPQILPHRLLFMPNALECMPRRCSLDTLDPANSFVAFYTDSVQA